MLWASDSVGWTNVLDGHLPPSGHGSMLHSTTLSKRFGFLTIFVLALCYRKSHASNPG